MENIEENKQVEGKGIELENNLNKSKKKAGFWIAIGIAFFVFAIILSIMLIIFFKNMQSTPKNSEEAAALISEQAPEELRQRLIDGVTVPKGGENLPPVAVMIDNHFEARPPAGIDRAQIVFEAEVEGSFTRLMAIFTFNEEVEEIGPVRSARPYFLDWADEFSALYVHVGGSPEALARMIDEDSFHINEFYNQYSFWRSQSRLAPHNVMTSSKLIKDYLEKEGVESGKYLSWEFREENEERNIENQKISIDYAGTLFDVDWTFDKENNEYTRYQGGDKHLVSQGKEIRAKNVLILEAENKVVDEIGRLKMSNLGKGEVLVCNEGLCQGGVWRKLSSKSRLRFYDENDSEISLIPGTTWIQVIQPGYEVVY